MGRATTALYMMELEHVQQPNTVKNTHLLISLASAGREFMFLLLFLF